MSINYALFLVYLYIAITPLLMYYNINRRAKKELTEVCGTYESDCSRCPKKTECDEYNSIFAQNSRNAPAGASTVGRSPGADDGRPERENMKDWTIEKLYDLWRGRGYTKKEAQMKAEKDFREMHRKKSETELHQIMQEMLYS